MTYGVTVASPGAGWNHALAILAPCVHVCSTAVLYGVSTARIAMKPKVAEPLAGSSGGVQVWSGDLGDHRPAHLATSIPRNVCNNYTLLTLPLS